MPEFFPVGLLFTVKGNLEPLTEVEKKLHALGVGLRLTGRDMMRLGGSMDRFFSGVMAKIGGVLKGSLLWEAGLQDISWALEDVGYLIGDYLAPLLDFVVGIIEDFTGALERNPLLFWLSLLAVAGVIFGLIISKLLTLVGTFNLYTGTLLIASKAHLGLGATLRALIIQATQGDAAMKAYIASLKEIGRETTAAASLQGQIARLREQKASLEQVGDALYKYKASLFSGGKLIAGNELALKTVNAEIANNQKAQAKNAIQLAVVETRMQGVAKTTQAVAGTQKGQIIQTRKWTAALKGGLKTALKFAGIGTIIALAGSFLFQAWEPLADLMESIGEIFLSIVEPLTPMIEGLTQWIEENPELAKTLLLIILAVLAALVVLPKLGGAISAIGGLFGMLGPTVGGVINPIQQTSAANWQATLANAALLAAVAALIVALTHFFVTLGTMGISVWEAIAAFAAFGAVLLGFLAGLSLTAVLLTSVQGSIWIGIAALAALVAIAVLLTYAFTQLLVPLMDMPGGIANLTALIVGITGMMAALSGIAILLGTFSVAAGTGTIILLGLAAAALGFGAAFLMAGTGLELAAKGITVLTANLHAIVALVAPVFALGVGIGALAIAGVLAIPVLIGLALAVGALTIALGALLIPLAGIRALGGEGAVIEALRKLPSLQEGGVIIKGGVAILHAGEEVRPAEVVRRREEAVMAPPVVIQINAPVGSREIAQSFADEIDKILDRKLMRGR